MMYYVFLVCTSDLQISSDCVVHLHTVTDIDFSKLASLKDMKVAAANSIMVHRMEEILTQWCKQIEQVGKITFLHFRGFFQFILFEKGQCTLINIRKKFKCTQVSQRLISFSSPLPWW